MEHVNSNKKSISISRKLSENHLFAVKIRNLFSLSNEPHSENVSFKQTVNKFEMISEE